MTSLLTSVKQSGGEGYYISVASLVNRVFGINSAGVPSTASWAYFGPGASMSTVASSGAVLKDLGKTVVSSLRTFRKVQLMLPGSNSTLSTFGVGGRATAVGEDYLTGYIELGLDGNGNPAPVAKFGR
jgi:hypothetical protein